MTKISLGVFLCLSLFMLSCSIIRAAGMYNQSNGALDVPWGVFWIHAEACIGVLMGSITVYRSALVGPTNACNNFRRFVNKVIRMRTSGHVSEEPKELSLPAHIDSILLSKIPNAALTYFATRIADPDHTHEKGIDTSTIPSNVDPQELDYHMFLKYQPEQQHSSAKTQRTLGEASCPGECKSLLVLVISYYFANQLLTFA